jgi:hypothetical protein
MEYRIRACDLARELEDVLSGVRRSGDSFAIVESGDPVARMVQDSPASTTEALGAWMAAGEPDPDFADLLEEIGSAL